MPKPQIHTVETAPPASQGLLQGLKESESEILESLAAVAAPMLASAVALVADPPLDALFQPQSWTRRV